MGHIQLYDGYSDGFYQQNDLTTATRVVLSSTLQEFDWGAGYHLQLMGSGFTYGGPNNARLSGGVVTGMDLLGPYGRIVVTGVHADAAVLGLSYLTGDPALSSSTLGAGDDLIEVMGTAAPATDTDFTVLGWAGDDTMLGGGSRSTLLGGDGNDTINARAGDGNYLRGDAGNDTIVGAAGFDDINGNMGADNLRGGDGGDWVVGGKDDDLQYGEAGADVVWGNLGAGHPRRRRRRRPGARRPGR